MNQTGRKSRRAADCKTQASRLFLDGYRAERLDEETVIVRDPEGSSFLVNPLFQTCTCDEALATSRCVHLLGYARLLTELQGYEEALIAMMEAEHDPWGMTLESDRLDREVRETGFCTF